MFRINYILFLLILTNTVFGQKIKDYTFYVGANLFPNISTQVGGQREGVSNMFIVGFNWY